MVVRCQHQVVIVGQTFGAQSTNWLLDCRHIGAIVQLVDCRRTGTIIWSVNCRYISTIIIYVGSSTVPAMGLFGWQYNASNGVIFIGILV